MKALSVFLGHPWLLFLRAGGGGVVVWRRGAEELTPVLQFPSLHLKEEQLLTCVGFPLSPQK